MKQFLGSMAITGIILTAVLYFTSPELFRPRWRVVVDDYGRYGYTDWSGHIERGLYGGFSSSNAAWGAMISKKKWSDDFDEQKKREKSLKWRVLQ